jgi:hypothetical protein
VLATFGEVVPVLVTSLHLHPGYESYGVTVPAKLRHHLLGSLQRSGLDVVLVPAVPISEYRDPRFFSDPSCRGALFNSALPGELVDAELDVAFELGAWSVRLVSSRAFVLRRGAPQRELLTHYGKVYVRGLVEAKRLRAADHKRTSPNKNRTCSFSCACVFNVRSQAKALARCPGNIAARVARAARLKRSKGTV